MGGAPVTVVCYRNGVDSYGTWVTDRTVLERVRALAHEGGERLVGDVIWNGSEPWTRRLTEAWPAVDTFAVSLCLDRDYTPPAALVSQRAPRKGKGKKR